MQSLAALNAQQRADLIKQANAKFRSKEDLYKYLSRIMVSGIPLRS